MTDAAIKKVASKKPTIEAGKKVGSLTKDMAVRAIEVVQGSHRMYLFKASASKLFGMLSINRRIEDKDAGYQRTLALGRIQAMSRHILDKKPVPGAIVVCFDNAVFAQETSTLTIPAGTDVGWVIDGQHRLAGSETAAREGLDIELSVVSFIGLSQPQQIEQFITINREAKNVPTSLYLDLLGKLPNKNPADAGRERAVDLANRLRKDEESSFFMRIAVTVAPKPNQLSLTNFTRKLIPLVLQDKGILGVYTELEQYKVIDNFYTALHQVFPDEFESKTSIFFKTLGFGALWNVFPTVFSLALKYHQGFEVKDVIAILKRIEGFDFAGWKQYGSGNLAETNAAEDIRVALDIAFARKNQKGTLRV